MAVVALIVAVILFTFATFTDGAFGLAQAELAYLGLAALTVSFVLGAFNVPTWPRRE